MTDAAGVELENAFEERIEPVAGADLYLSLDVNIQQYAEQAALTVMEQKAQNGCLSLSWILRMGKSWQWSMYPNLISMIRSH